MSNHLYANSYVLKVRNEEKKAVIRAENIRKKYLEIRDRKVAEKRIYPAINVRRSGTRREDLLTSEEELQRMWILRKLLSSMEDVQATEFILDKLKGTKTNDEFFNSMKRN